MSDATVPRHAIEVSDEVYDLLHRTATSRGTDLNGALRYLLDVPPVPTERPEETDEE